MRRALIIFTVIVSSGLLAAPAVMQECPLEPVHTMWGMAG
ncbi:MAG: hypothetical protein Ct9H300mP25_05860 [Acidobacteriota bacterium]|nr:MAG: hypothetical protein Ct9H300mP25_05860 [Acidobacteriota bacterium]